jgi:hypothetical protein
MKKSAVLKQEFIEFVQAKIDRLKAENKEGEMLKEVKEKRKRYYFF